MDQTPHPLSESQEYNVTVGADKACRGPSKLEHRLDAVGKVLVFAQQKILTSRRRYDKQRHIKYIFCRRSQ